VPLSSLGRLGGAAALVTLAAYVALLPGGVWHNVHRYLYPIGVPLLALGMGTALARPEFVWRTVAIAVIAVSAVAWPFTRMPDAGEPADRLAAAAWVREHIDSNATLLVQDAGVFAVFTENPLVDLVGLKSPASVPVHEAITWPSCGADRSRAVAEIARASGARYVIVSTAWDEIFSLTRGLESQGLRLELVRGPQLAVYCYSIYRLAGARPDQNVISKRGPIGSSSRIISTS
jgi:hypothetical protein